MVLSWVKVESMTEFKEIESKEIGRNEPCPCGSRKKYKRCCGVSAAPKLTMPKPMPNDLGYDPSILDQFDPQMMMQMTQAFQKLPKGQLQRMQALMQKAMNGKDITSEAQEFEKSLPPDFQQMMSSWAVPQLNDPDLVENQKGALEIEQQKMTEDRARELIVQAIAEGAISREQGDSLLQLNPSPPSIQIQGESRNQENSQTEVSVGVTEEGATSKFGRLWKNISGKRPS